MSHFDDLYTFITVVQAGSFTKAAGQLGVSKSALSQTISQLEQRLNIRLLNRTTRSLAPTTAGEKVLAEFAPMFASMQNSLRELNDFHDHAIGTIRINSSEVAAYTVLYPKLAPLLAQNPHLHIELQIENVFVDIVEKGFDMGVRLGNAVQQNMIAVQISEPMQMALVAGREYMASNHQVTQIDDLSRHQLIGTRLSSDHQPAEWEFFKDNQTIIYQPKPHFAVNNRLRIQAVLDGLGISWLPKMWVDEYLENGAMVELLPDWAMTYEPLYLYYPNRKYHSKAFEMVVGALRL